MRLFTAIKICKELSTKISDLQKEIPGNIVKWVDKNNFHLTLHFLGETDYEVCQLIKEELKAITRDMEEFTIDIAGKGVFPNKKKPRVIWVGVQRSEPLEKLYSSSSKILKKYGFEARPYFKPHITIGRIKLVNNTLYLSKYLSEDSNVFLGTQKISEIYLFESKLKPDGPHYHVLGKFPFQEKI